MPPAWKKTVSSGFLAVPAEALVEGPGPADVGDAERDQADALLHQGAT